MSKEICDILDAILERQREALRQGRRPTIESLLDGHADQDDPELILDLLYNEIVVLEEIGEPPNLDSYIQRYPQLEEDLRLHFEVHRAVSGPLLEATDDVHGDKTWTESRQDSSDIGAFVGGYEISRQLGQGGMGVVYRARDHRLQRDIALKIFHPGRIPTQREALRFQAEAESLARLAHPNIVRIYDVGENAGCPFLALELIDNGTLAQHLQETVFSPRDAAQLIETLAEAVQHAHENQVIHRDLKPANVLFDRNGVAKIADFGLAKLACDDAAKLRDATRSGEPIGTPRYMSPEQAAGQIHQIGPTTDVYGLGTLLYECMTGQAPFVASSVVETLQKIRHDDPVPPRRLQPSIPRDLETICLRCLEKQPSRRYATALELSNDLRRFLRHEPIQARRVTALERGWKWCRRYPAHAALMAIGCFLMVSLLAVAAIGKQAEDRRLQDLRIEIAGLVRDGQSLLEQGEGELAYGRFQQAWQIVESEAKLVDHRPGVGGWLDHSRRAVNKEQWKQRMPPRDFDERRDLALIESVLLDPKPERPIASARESIRAAMELTLADDPAWKSPREMLTLVESELVANEGSLEKGLKFLDSTEEFSSRPFHLARADYLEKLGRTQDAAVARERASQFPPEQTSALFIHGMSHLRQREYGSALADFDELLEIEPEHFTARLFQAMCFINLRRFAEARVALTACIAQRPGFYWSYYLRGLSNLHLMNTRSALHDLLFVLELKPSQPVRDSVNSLLEEARAKTTNPRSVEQSKCEE